MKIDINSVLAAADEFFAVADSASQIEPSHKSDAESFRVGEIVLVGSDIGRITSQESKYIFNVKFRDGEKRVEASRIKKATGARIEPSHKADADPCRDGYEQRGMKTKDGRGVPNCVPESKADASNESVDELKRERAHAIKMHQKWEEKRTDPSQRRIAEASAKEWAAEAARLKTEIQKAESRSDAEPTIVRKGNVWIVTVDRDGSESTFTIDADQYTRAEALEYASQIPQYTNEKFVVADASSPACTFILVDGRTDQVVRHQGNWQAIVKREVADLKKMDVGRVTTKEYSDESVGYAKHDSNDKLSEHEREEIGREGSKHREDMPAKAFLKPSDRTYPVKVKSSDGIWEYDRKLLVAAARDARMAGHDDLAREADTIREREFNAKDDSDSAFKSAPYSSMTTAALRAAAEKEKDRATKDKMDGELARREKVAAGDRSVMTNGERLRHQRARGDADETEAQYIRRTGSNSGYGQNYNRESLNKAILNERGKPLNGKEVRAIHSLLRGNGR